jgi:thiol-disulfide isomerase/thioredoxin
MARGCVLLALALAACTAPREGAPAGGEQPALDDTSFADTSPTDARTLEVLDLYGRGVRPLASDGRPVVVLFTATTCPISNRYAPEVGRLVAEFGGEVDFWLIYADPDEDADAVREHAHVYGYRARVARDPAHHMVAVAGARVTPEAAVFDVDGRLVYTGRIDDRWVDFGQSRAAPTVRDLERVLLAVLAEDAVLGGGAAPIRTPAVGCPIPPVVSPVNPPGAGAPRAGS